VGGIVVIVAGRSRPRGKGVEGFMVIMMRRRGVVESDCT